METQQFPMEEEQEEAVGVVGEKDERPLYERIAAFLKRVWGPFLISAVAEWPGNYLAQKEDEFFAHFERIVALAPPEGASGAIDEEMSALLHEAGDEAEATPEENETSQQQRRLIALCIFVQNFLYLGWRLRQWRRPLERQREQQRQRQRRGLSAHRLCAGRVDARGLPRCDA